MHKAHSIVVEDARELQVRVYVECLAIRKLQSPNSAAKRLILLEDLLATK